MPLTESAHTYTLIYFKLLYVFCILFCILIVSLFACCTPHNSHVPCRCLSLPPHTSSQLLGPTSLGIETMLRSLYSARTWAFYIYHIYTYVHILLHIPYVYICTLFGIKTMLYLRNRHALVSLNTFYIPLCLCILRLTRSSLQMKMSIALTVCILGDPYFVHFT